ncbi:MAG: hypothetical protein CM15mP52_0820 [Candidatus Neomarinimicrobiota bacterium]|nr:MAG: hypothetical protein CM15mP52_0820 [Candidatus Neomarinimicrobiota bacterium]
MMVRCMLFGKRKFRVRRDVVYETSLRWWFYRCLWRAGDCTGGTYDNPCEYHGQLIRLDANGDVVWNQTYEGSSGLYHARETSDGGFIAAGYYECVNSMDCYPDLYIVKTDANGMRSGPCLNNLLQTIMTGGEISFKLRTGTMCDWNLE